MIHNAVIHLVGKLPIVADLRTVPAATDQGVLCTNVRTRDGKRPTFIDDGKGWFLIPMHEVTIIEMPANALEIAVAEAPIHLGGGQVEGASLPARMPVQPDDADLDMTPLEPDEELLARIRGL